MWEKILPKDSVGWSMALASKHYVTPDGISLTSLARQLNFTLHLSSIMYEYFSWNDLILLHFNSQGIDKTSECKGVTRMWQVYNKKDI